MRITISGGEVLSLPGCLLRFGSGFCIHTHEITHEIKGGHPGPGVTAGGIFAGTRSSAIPMMLDGSQTPGRCGFSSHVLIAGTRWPSGR
jgi:hypothetical protein